MRLFAGFKLSKESLATIKQVLKPDVKISWVHPDNLHLTARFFGETAPEKLPKLVEALRAVCQSHTAFDIRTMGVGAFPNTRRAHIFWLGIKEDSGALQSLAIDLENMAVSLGFKPEKRAYFPHLTIGRDRHGHTADAVLTSYKNKDFGLSHLDRLVLFESVSDAKGAHYQILEEFPLKIVD